ncbi:hypothetical protein, partial [Stenomitos frigidus]|uniref:hypothetical protein n=1 Tax=Stenomitos frigidus TaxID=1886765 RepID=UPI001C6374D6
AIQNYQNGISLFNLLAGKFIPRNLLTRSLSLTRFTIWLCSVSAMRGSFVVFPGRKRVKVEVRGVVSTLSRPLRFIVQLHLPPTLLSTLHAYQLPTATPAPLNGSYRAGGAPCLGVPT